MSTVKPLLDGLLWDIYGKRNCYRSNGYFYELMCDSVFGLQRSALNLEKLNVQQLLDVCNIMKLELRLMSYLLKQELITRDRNRRHQGVLCGFVTAILNVLYYAVKC